MLCSSGCRQMTAPVLSLPGLTQEASSSASPELSSATRMAHPEGCCAVEVIFYVPQSGAIWPGNPVYYLNRLSSERAKVGIWRNETEDSDGIDPKILGTRLGVSSRLWS